MAAGSSSEQLRLHTPMFGGRAIHAFTSPSQEYLRIALERSFTASVVTKLTYDDQIVEMLPLDSLNLTADIVKIDVEGRDHEVLLGLAQTTDRYRPTVMVEFDPGECRKHFHFFLCVTISC